MSVKVSFLTGGTNSLQTTSEDFNKMLTWFKSPGIPFVGTMGAYTGDFAVKQKTGKVVTVTAGKYICQVTPTGETLRNVMVELSADYDITLADNVTGATRYDKVYIYLPAASLANAPANGDFTEVATLKVQRDTTRGAAITDINSVKIAEIEVPTSFATITNPQIQDFRVTSDEKDGWRQAPAVTYVSGTTGSGSGFLKYLQVGDKFKGDQSIALNSYFPFDVDGSDSKGTATVTPVNTPTYTAGKFGNALTLNGTDQALAITDATVFKPTGAFSLGCWVKPTADANAKFIFQSYSDNTNANGFRIYVAGTTGVVTVGIGNNAASDSSYVTGTTDITGAWHYVVISSQGNNTKIFVDGVLDASGNTVTPTYAATNYVRIGVQSSSGNTIDFMKGQIDDLFFIKGHAVDQYWVAAKYAAATAQTTANITATYQGYVTAVTDTLLTLNGGADYALYNGTITSPYYSHSNPVGFPDWFNVAAPTWDTTTIDNGSGGQPTTTSSRMSMEGRTVKLHYMGSGVKAGANGNIAITSNVYPTPVTGYTGGIIGSTRVQTSTGSEKHITSSLLVDAGTPTKWWVLLYNTAFGDNDTLASVTFKAEYEI